jgi:hypothetical protein
MKSAIRYISLLFLFVFIMCRAGNSAYAQGYTLQFNRVLLVSSVLQTVPANKVWKVEKMLTSSFMIYQYSSGNCNSSNSDPYQVIIDGAVYFLAEELTTGQSGYQYAPGSTKGPLWLPAGTTLKTQCSSSLLSIIEFNLVQ